MFKVMIRDNMSPKAKEILEQTGQIEVVVDNDKATSDPKILASLIHEFDGLGVRSGTKVTAEVFDKAANLKVVGRAGIGVDNIDVASATGRGIVVMNAPGGNTVTTGEHAEIESGNALPLKNIPLGTLIHNVELKIGKGGQLIRSGGGQGRIMAKEGKYAHVRLPSGEVRLVHQECYATIGQLSNLEHDNISFGKAGKSRWLGKRPHVRGVAMNPVDHPLGGGEGKSSGGRHPVSPWGIPAKGYKTRKNKATDKYIVKKRK